MLVAIDGPWRTHKVTMYLLEPSKDMQNRLGASNLVGVCLWQWYAHLSPEDQPDTGPGWPG